MSDHHHPVDDALRRVAGNPQPTDEEQRFVERQLRTAIASELGDRPRSIRRKRAMWAIAIAVSAVGLFVLLQALRPSPTLAAIEEVAAAAERSDPLQVGEQDYAYTQSEISALAIVPKDMLGDVGFEENNLVYLLPVQREIWQGADGAVQIRTTVLAPTFFSNEDEAAYYQAGLDAVDNVGETTTDVFETPQAGETWPEDIAAIDEDLQAAAAGRPRPQSVEYLDVALDVLRESVVSPKLRANILRLIGDLDGLVLIADDDGTKTFAITYRDSGVETRLSFTVSSDGELLEEQVVLLQPHPTLPIPEDTTISKATYSPPVVVASLNAP